MQNELPGFLAAIAEAHPVHGVVQAGFRPAQQVVAGCALLTIRGLEILAELSFQQTVDAFQLLLFSQLQTVIGKLRPALTVLTRRIRTAFKRALIAKATIALQEELHVLSTAKLTN
jgi:hypothetical protein